MEVSEIGKLPSVDGITGNPITDGEITEETFLKLLSTQLQYQDPLEPASDVEFIQQMATFSMLEQQRITNDNLGILQLYDSSINNSNALNIVGKDVKLADDTITHEGGSHTIFYDSSAQASRVNFSILDANGREVFTTTNVGANDGQETFTWNGQDNEGNAVAPGEYQVRITLEDDAGNAFPTGTYQRKRVEGLAYEGGSIILLVGNKRIPIENVIEVYENSDAGDSGSIDFKNAGSHGYPLNIITGGR